MSEKKNGKKHFPQCSALIYFTRVGTEMKKKLQIAVALACLK